MFVKSFIRFPNTQSVSDMNGREFVRSLMTVPITAAAAAFVCSSVSDRPCSLCSINAPLAAGILDARTSIISRSRVTDPFHFPYELSPVRVRGWKNIHHARRQWRVRNSSSSPAPTWTRIIIHTVHRLNDNSLPLLSHAVDLSQYLPLPFTPPSFPSSLHGPS